MHGYTEVIAAGEKMEQAANKKTTTHVDTVSCCTCFPDKQTADCLNGLKYTVLVC